MAMRVDNAREQAPALRIDHALCLRQGIAGANHEDLAVLHGNAAEELARVVNHPGVANGQIRLHPAFPSSTLSMILAMPAH